MLFYRADSLSLPCLCAACAEMHVGGLFHTRVPYPFALQFGEEIDRVPAALRRVESRCRADDKSLPLSILFIIFLTVNRCAGISLVLT